MRRIVRVVLVLLVGLLGYGVGLAQPIVVRPPLVVGQDAITDAASRGVRVSVDEVGGRVISVEPDDPRLLFVLYPGGLVRPQAYEWLARALAARGVHTVIPEFPADFAFLDPDRATRLAERYAGGRPVVLAGHSLGGAMAAAHAADRPDAFAGLVLMASYPPDNASLAAAPFPAVSLLAEHDTVADPDAVRGGLARLPADTELVVIAGAVHSFFGRYGPQQGDGRPTVSRAEAEAVILEEVSTFLDPIG